jgi:alpha-galactosidase
MEWDIREAVGAERETLRELVGLYKEHRALLHSGTAVRADLSEPAHSLYGTVSPDRSEALLAFVSLATPDDEAPGSVALPGLDPERTYRVRGIVPGNEPGTFGHRVDPAWLRTTSGGEGREGIVATGRHLATIGIPLPALNPERAMLLRIEEAPRLADESRGADVARAHDGAHDQTAAHDQRSTQGQDPAHNQEVVAP